MEEVKEQAKREGKDLTEEEIFQRASEKLSDTQQERWGNSEDSELKFKITEETPEKQRRLDAEVQKGVDQAEGSGKLG